MDSRGATAVDHNHGQKLFETARRIRWPTGKAWAKAFSVTVATTSRPGVSG